MEAARHGTAGMSEAEQQSANESAPRPAPGFGDLAGLGRNAPWRYGLSFAGVIGVGFALSFALYGLFIALDWLAPLTVLRDPAAAREAALAARLGAFALIMATVILFLLPARLFLPLLHRRPWRSFVTARPRFSLRAMFSSFAVLFALLLAALALQLTLAPDTLTLSFDPAAFAAFFALALLLVPLQALAEEVVFRGFILQAVGRVTGSFLLRAAVPALVFTLAHLANPELAYGALWAAASYALAGLYLSILALRGGGLELPLGAHIATNLFVSLIARPEVSALNTAALFIEPAPNLPLSLAATAVVFAVHYFVIMRLARHMR
jgi:hypothetical protein